MNLPLKENVALYSLLNSSGAGKAAAVKKEKKKKGRVVPLWTDRMECPPPGAAASMIDGESLVRGLWAGARAPRGPRDRRVSAAKRRLRGDSPQDVMVKDPGRRRPVGGKVVTWGRGRTAEGGGFWR